MEFLERSYSGKVFRPRPEVHIEKDGSLLIVATPWGPRSAARKAIKTVKDYYLSSLADMEATSPFNKLTCLSPTANELRIALKLANDTIYNEDNKSEYVSGVEMTVIARTGSEISYVNVGMPYIFLDRAQKFLLPLTSQNDLSAEHSHSSSNLAPLPGKLLGTDNESDFAVESIHIQPHDRLLLAARTGFPPEILRLPPNERHLDQLSRICSQEDPDLPFWIGILSM